MWGELSPLTYLVVMATAFGVTVLLTPAAIRLGKRWGLVAVPGERRRHKGRVVRIGGFGLFPAFAAAAGMTLLLNVPRSDPLEVTRMAGVLVGMGLVWILGLLDDRFELSPAIQLTGLVVAALVAIQHRVFVEVFNTPFSDTPVWVNWYVMLPVTLVWIVGMTGTINMLDGLDGLATGVTAISAIALTVHMLRLGQYSVSLLPLALAGCCLGFLPFNARHPRIFLGGGAYVLGYGLACLSIVAGAKVASALLVLWLPIVDVVWQFYSRARKGQPLGLGDRGHLHLRLQDSGWPQYAIVVLYCTVTVGLGAVALFISSRLLKLAVLVAVGVIILAGLVVLARKPHAGGALSERER